MSTFMSDGIYILFILLVIIAYIKGKQTGQKQMREHLEGALRQNIQDNHAITSLAIERADSIEKKLQIYENYFKANGIEPINENIDPSKVKETQRGRLRVELWSM